ncbi:MAG TPA: PH domain-containing protein [Candidatus Binatia bacterium]|nr:PH domain-containing protein [Candidatus Binatia bacterium]
MIDIRALEQQLKKAECNFQFWGKGELRELKHILLDNEEIIYGVNGRYSGGFALLCVTNKRLLLVDHKPMYLSLEDIRFDMISEVDYNYRLLNATVSIFTPNKSLVFTSWSQHKLRELTKYTQTRVMEIRQYYMGQQFQEERVMAATTAAPTPNFTTGVSSQADSSTLQHAGRLSVGSASTPNNILPMHNPYAQVPLVSRHWSRRGVFSRAT